MQVSTRAELRRAVKSGEPEIVVADDRLCRSVRIWSGLRAAANILVIIVLVAAIVMWVNPLKMGLFETATMLLVRRIVLGVGVLLLFADYVIPVVRLYKVAGRDDSGLKLVPRKTDK
jgi:hypothetical protein